MDELDPVADGETVLHRDFGQLAAGVPGDIIADVTAAPDSEWPRR